MTPAPDGGVGPHSNLANNLFASGCDSLRPTISCGTRHLPSSSWPSRLVATAEADRLNISPCGRNLWLLGIWLEQNVLKKIPFQDRYNEFTDELTNPLVPERCLER